MSPASTLRRILLLASFRAVFGMVAVVALVGPGALPILIPGIPAVFCCYKAWRHLEIKATRFGLCLSSAMWLGTAAAVVAHDRTPESIVLSGAIAFFAFADTMFSTMRVERVP